MPSWRQPISVVLIALALTVVTVAGLGIGSDALADGPTTIFVPIAPKGDIGQPVTAPIEAPVIEGCNPYPATRYFNDTVVAAGIVHNPGSGTFAGPSVTITWLDANGLALQVLPVGGLPSLLEPLHSLGFRQEIPLASVPGWRSIRCDLSISQYTATGFDLVVDNLSALGGPVKTVSGRVTNNAGSPTGAWAIFAGYRADDGRILASASEYRTDSIPAHGHATFALPLDRAIDESATVIGLAGSGSQPTPTPAPPTATPTVVTGTSTPSATPTQPTATPTVTPTATSTPSPTSTPGWTTVPTVTGSKLRSLSLTSDDDGWATGDDGIMLRLRASLWYSAFTPVTGTQINALQMISDEVGYAVGANGTILGFSYSPTSTVQQWSTLVYTTSPITVAATITGEEFTALSFLNRSYGWIGGASGRLYMFDGSVLTLISDTLPMTITGLAVQDASHAWASRGNRILAYGVPGLTPWSPVYTASQPLRAIAFNGGWKLAAGDNGLVLKNSGLPADWSVISPTNFSLAGVGLYGLSLRSSGTDGWAVGSGGAAVRITGLNLFTSSVPATATLNSGQSRSANKAWAVGDNGTIIRFSDPSQPSSTPTATPTPIWQQPATPVPGVNLNSVAVISPTLLWAVGDNGTILKSIDGQSWVATTSPTTATLRSVAGSPASGSWIGGEGGTLLGYLAGSWLGLSTGVTSTGTISAVAIFDPATGVAVNSEAVTCCILRNGLTWSFQPAGTTDRWNGLALQDANTGWLVGAGGKISRYLSGTVSSVSAPAGGELRAVSVLSNGVGMAVGDGGRLLRYDVQAYGAQWVNVSSPTSSNLWAVVLLSSNEGWAVGDGGTVIRLHNGAWTVENILYPTAVNFRGVAALPTGDVWIVGTNGTIYHRAPNGSYTTGALYRKPPGGW